ERRLVKRKNGFMIFMTFPCQMRLGCEHPAGAQTPSFTRSARLACCLGRTPRSIGTEGQSHLKSSAVVGVMSHSRRQRETTLTVVYFIAESFFVVLAVTNR